MAWVEASLAKPEGNIGWMPDAIEKKLKSDIFVMLLGLVDHILETTKIEIMGHDISFAVHPEPDLSSVSDLPSVSVPRTLVTKQLSKVNNEQLNQEISMEIINM